MLFFVVKKDNFCDQKRRFKTFSNIRRFILVFPLGKEHNVFGEMDPCFYSCICFPFLMLQSQYKQLLSDIYRTKKKMLQTIVLGAHMKHLC